MELQLRPTLSLVRTIARIERAAGNWDRLGLNNAVTTERARRAALDDAVAATLKLESGAQPHAADRLRSALASAYQREFRLDLATLQEIYRSLTGSAPEAVAPFRAKPLEFEVPPADGAAPQSVFRTISPFLIEQRLGDLLAWTETELELDALHPLLTAAVFQLCFLQIAPFPAFNHSLALISVQQMLALSGYGFCEFAPPACELLRDRKRYLAALRKSERSAGGDWSTLNAWLEVFLQAIGRGVSELVCDEAQNLDRRRLSNVQQRIVEIVRVHGPLSRDTIAERTGINASTVKYNLGVLARRGHLKREGGGRGTSYTVS